MIFPMSKDVQRCLHLERALKMIEMEIRPSQGKFMDENSHPLELSKFPVFFIFALPV